ncbi:MAG: putative Ig domain-containing protein [Thermoguttaceae bacterium]|jgi:hypothetical protein
MYNILFLMTTALLLSPGADAALEPWASKAQPGDVAKRHVEEVAKGEHAYTVVHGGTMDGTNCRTPIGCGMAREGAIEQTWQSNRAVRMENVGRSDLVDPWLSNGRNNFRNMDEIVAAAVTPGMSDRDKAMALWFQQIRQRFHRAGDGQETGDPVKVFNTYGHNPCGSDAIIMGGLWRRAGLKGAPVRLVSHAIAQAAYDGGWHVMDGDLDMIYLLRDNETLASDRELARDHDLVKRTHTLGILLADSRARDEEEAAMFVCEDPIKGERRCKEDTTMSMTLRPGEALVWRWGHLSPPKYMWKSMQPNYPDTVCNGLWEYRPDFGADLWKKGAARLENIATGPEGLGAEEGTTGTILWTMRSPYVFVGGKLEVVGSGAKFAVSADGKRWENVGENLDKFFPTDGPPRYQYQLRCQLSGGARLKRLAVVNDLQMALLALPEMTVGENAFTYTDKSTGERKVRITHEWVERSTSTPPESPPAAVYPPDAGQSEGTGIVFRWNAPQDAGGDKVTDYHFELSNRQDMRWPLSPNFDKLVSRTADKGKPQYTLPCLGLVTPDKQYYWRVRAKNEKGVWGPWSKTWSFTPRGPSCPVEVALDFDRSEGAGTLKWKPNPAGRRPAKFRVYGSDEQGFSVSDVPYKVNAGISKELPPHFPANFIAETTATELAVLGGEVALPAANKTYYRVVAVDEQGRRSGPSDYATAPRPVIYGTPAVQAKVGAEYRSQVLANRSLGDLRLHGPQTPNFWNVEKPKYALEQGPSWLKLDAATGALSGTPDAAGKFEVAITATIDRQVRKLDQNALGWGVEKVLSTSVERVGTTTRKFIITVQ